jgi:hypothetical protein
MIITQQATIPDMISIKTLRHKNKNWNDFSNNSDDFPILTDDSDDLFISEIFLSSLNDVFDSFYEIIFAVNR